MGLNSKLEPPRVSRQRGGDRRHRSSAPRKLFGVEQPQLPAAALPMITAFGQTGNPYEELGVTTVINCEGTMTMLGGSLCGRKWKRSWRMAGQHFVSDAGVGSRRGQAHRGDAEAAGRLHRAGHSGAAAAMQSGLAGILTGDNRGIHQSRFPISPE